MAAEQEEEGGRRGGGRGEGEGRGEREEERDEEESLFKANAVTEEDSAPRQAEFYSKHGTPLQ